MLLSFTFGINQVIWELHSCFCIVSAPCRTAYIELHFGFIPSACVGGHYTETTRNRSHSVLSNYEELSFGELEFCINCWKIWVMKVVHYCRLQFEAAEGVILKPPGKLSCSHVCLSASVEYGLFSSFAFQTNVRASPWHILTWTMVRRFWEICFLIPLCNIEKSLEKLVIRLNGNR